MNNQVTVVYYTSNREDPSFEKYIQKRLLSVIGDLPLISVSQQPISDFGYNINIGEVDVNEQTLWRQMLIGCSFAKTPYVLFAEADTLYPPEYFTHVPNDINKRYWFEGVYIFYPKKEAFYDKGRSDVAHIAGRELMQKVLSEGLFNNKKQIYEGMPRPTRIDLKIPVVSIKTGNGMRPSTQTALDPVYELPYWGTASNLKKEIGL